MVFEALSEPKKIDFLKILEWCHPLISENVQRKSQRFFMFDEPFATDRFFFQWKIHFSGLYYFMLIIITGSGKARTMNKKTVYPTSLPTHRRALVWISQRRGYERERIKRDMDVEIIRVNVSAESLAVNSSVKKIRNTLWFAASYKCNASSMNYRTMRLFMLYRGYVYVPTSRVS